MALTGIQPVKWIGDPGECNGCNQRLDVGDRFYDVVAVNGQWGNFCPACASTYAHMAGAGEVALGVGLGQLYQKRILGTEVVWEKIAG